MAMQQHAEPVGQARANAVTTQLGPAGAASGLGRQLKLGWTTTIRARLLGAFFALSLATVIACAIGIALFVQIGDLFDQTVATGVRQYGGLVRLREQAVQLANASASFSGAADRDQLKAAQETIERAQATVKDELDGLRETGLTEEVAELDPVFAEILNNFKQLQTITIRRIEAREPRAALSAAALAQAALLDNLINPRFFGDALDLAISIQGDQIDDGADALAAKRTAWAADVQRLQEMLQFRVATSAASAILAETSELSNAKGIDADEARFADVARTIEKFRAAFGDNNSPVAKAAAKLIGIGRGDGGLFSLRRKELAAIVDENNIAEPTQKMAHRLASQLRDTVKDERAAMDATAQRSHEQLAWAKKVLFLIAVGSLLASLAIILGYVARRITGRLLMLTRSMTRLAAGDREAPVPALTDRDEIGDMARALQVFKDQAVAMNELTERVIANIRQVAIAATQASTAVGQVSDGSKMQLTALEQSAGALGQSTEAISEVARSTERASEHSRRAADLVASGIAQMDEMVEIVLAISQNSTQIRRIANAIAQIANQTNMLSLNAAIEAARAGEHGKGFSVVAEEVRKLAENAGGLAREIADQVRQSTEQAEKGVDMVRQVSASMEGLAGGVRESDSLSNSIASAMSEQQVIVTDINSNLAKLTRIGQANATAAEEIAATMLDLSSLAETTRLAVEDFNTLGVWGGQQPAA
ncbi:MAG TPA: methyl-accepting chemotaxis protein [Stellaceae bacterium]|jgi:methyl-accepting chemotaxis protein|nr:methyl-accepting chemotaxis protein [Stellaceae bacterium]